MHNEITWQLALVGAVGALSATLFGIAALWAVGGRVNWFWRVAPLVLLLAALLPAGAYELLALFGTQTALVVGLVLSLRLIRRVRSMRRAGVRAADPTEPTARARQYAFRFGLVDVTKVVLLMAAVLAIVRLHSPDTATSLGIPIESRLWCISGVGAGLVTLAACYLVCGQPDRWYVRAVVFLLLIVFGSLLQVTLETSQLFTVFVFSFTQLSPAWILSCGALQALLTVTWLLFLRGAGWAWWGEGVSAAVVSTGESTADRARRFRPWSLGAALAGLSLCGVLLLGHFYWVLLPPAPLAFEPLPDPNGYDELMRLGRTLNWTAISNQDVEAASVPSCRTFLQDNSARLESMRRALALPCRNPSGPNLASFVANMPDIGPVRDLSRALEAEAKVAIADGQLEAAIASYLEMIRLGQSTARGGVAIHELIANAIEGIAQDSMIAQVDNLDAAALATLGRELQSRAANREPLSNVLERERNWRNLGLGWPGRLWYWTAEVLNRPNSTDVTAHRVRARVEARLRLLLAEAAVRRYVMANGSPPESLESLVPEYLSEVPQDPYGDGPLVYRRTPDGYLLYSVAANATDDGGQRVSLNEALQEHVGDVFFDAKWDAP